MRPIRRTAWRRASRVADTAGVPLPLVFVREEMLEVSMLLPDGWTVRVDGGSHLMCVADDSWEHGGFRPSITVQRYPHRSRDQVRTLAATTLSTMRESTNNYPDFRLSWARDGDGADRIVRCYEFRLPGARQRVRQIQGLIAGAGLIVVNATEAAADPRLQGTFVEVIGSVVG